MRSNGKIFLLNTDERLTPLAAQGYDSEPLLQRLLAQYPDLLAGEQVDPDSPRKWLLVSREMGVPDDSNANRWSLDHLFLDQDGVPTLIEAKRSSDPNSKLRHFLGLEAESDESATDGFWEGVNSNLRANRIRMIFVSDIIPTELRRIVEFLNELMTPAEVLAIEIRQFVGEGIKALVPRVSGQTEARRKKKQNLTGSRSPDSEISKGDFLEALSENPSTDPASVKAVERILDWAESNADLKLRFQRSPLRSKALIYVRTTPYLLTIWSGGEMYLNIKDLKSRHPFDSVPKLEELQAKIRSTGAISAEKNMDGQPPVDLTKLGRDDREGDFLGVMRWLVQQCSNS